MKKICLLLLSLSGLIAEVEDGHYKRVVDAVNQMHAGEYKKTVDQKVDVLKSDAREIALDVVREFRSKLTAGDAQRLAGVVQIGINICSILPDLQNDADPKKQEEAQLILHLSLQHLHLFLEQYIEAYDKFKTTQDQEEEKQERDVPQEMIDASKKFLQDVQDILKR